MGKPTVNVAAGQSSFRSVGPDQVAVLAKPGRFFSGYVYNTSGATLYVHIFDAASTPLDGATPELPPIVCPAGTNVSLDFWGGHYFGTGIAIVASTTDDTLTATLTNDMFFFATYR